MVLLKDWSEVVLWILLLDRSIIHPLYSDALAQDFASADVGVTSVDPSQCVFQVAMLSLSFHPPSASCVVEQVHLNNHATYEHWTCATLLQKTCIFH